MKWKRPYKCKMALRITNLVSYTHCISLLKHRNTLVLIRSKGLILYLVVRITYPYTSTESNWITAMYQWSLKDKTCWEWEFECLKQTTNQFLHGIYWPNSTVISVDNLHQLPSCFLKIKDRNLNIFWKSWHCQAKYVHMPDSFLSSSRGCSLLRLLPAKYICLIYVINFCGNEGWRPEKAECIYLSRGQIKIAAQLASPTLIWKAPASFRVRGQLNFYAHLILCPFRAKADNCAQFFQMFAVT